MRPATRAAITAGAVILVGAIAMIVRTLIAAGVFTAFTPGFAGTCQALAGVVGPEDLQIDASDRLVFVSATDRHAPAGHPSLQDGLYTFPLDHPEAGFTKLSGTPRDFHPHGLSLYRGSDGKLTLMVVNHQASGEQAVEIFDVAILGGGAKLTARGHIEGGQLISPNDLVAAGPDRFYVTNDFGSTTALGRTLEGYLLLPRSNVVYFNGDFFRPAITGLVGANGIALSPDGAHLYVAETLGRSVLSYRRDAFSGVLQFENATPLPAGADNIDVAADGALWVAGHPKILAVLDYAADRTKPSPSEIFRLPVQAGAPQAAALVYANSGRQIGAASVGAALGAKLFIGSPFDDKVLDCTLGR